ncbi:MAG: malto-oligosyltrehalose trehalohydrolase [Elusimicrobia bacterium]|nr:malto-oligosyltrehalose trehalohydrolase [Elusimicrobiota bacterium]
MNHSCPHRQGAFPSADGTLFRVWAPYAKKLDLLLSGKRKTLPMHAEGGGFHDIFVPGLKAGALYKYSINGGQPRPDPASNSQPQGVHGPSQTVDHAAFRWRDCGWKGITPDKLLLYELHTGTFSPRGDFAGIESKIPHLKKLGINAVELMPVAQFPGGRNWGYDGAFPYAPQNTYGGPHALKRLVDACHRAGLAVILDVVYNHLGPEGNYFGCYGPYFTGKYRTPWGRAVNFDGSDSVPVRDFFIQNALHWLRDYHIDGLRLDAIHGIFDQSACHFLSQLRRETDALSAAEGRPLFLIAESDLNDTRILRGESAGGYGLAAQWSDDFHHSLHALLTGENTGYYEDFGSFSHLAKAFSSGFVYDGGYSMHRRRAHGSPSGGLHPRMFVVCSQNHDQVGNRLAAERLSAIAGVRKARLAAGAVLLSPYVPLIFMGEEYAETAPFNYFVSHGDKKLIAAVRRGRRREFAAFNWPAPPPDPQDRKVFDASKLDWRKPARAPHSAMLKLYRSLLAVRRAHPSLGCLPRKNTVITDDEQNKILTLRRKAGTDETFTVFNFGGSSAQAALPQGRWRLLLSSEPGDNGKADGARRLIPAESFAIFSR